MKWLCVCGQFHIEFNDLNDAEPRLIEWIILKCLKNNNLSSSFVCFCFFHLNKKKTLDNFKCILMWLSISHEIQFKIKKQSHRNQIDFRFSIYLFLFLSVVYLFLICVTNQSFLKLNQTVWISTTHVLCPKNICSIDKTRFTTFP